MMLKLILLSAIFVACTGQRRKSVKENKGDCKEKCAANRCRKWAVDDHPCSAADQNNVLSLNPWRCGEARCEETDCSRCGDYDHCLSLCHDKRAELEADGYDLVEWASCPNVCAEGSDQEFMCFQDCNPRAKDETGKPICYDYWPCTEQYCTRKGRQDCYAMDNFVDPWDVTKGDRCKLTQCKRCGAQETCMAYCEDWNERKSNEEPVNCKTECASVEGYKCAFTPAMKEEDLNENREMQLFARLVAHAKEMTREKESDGTYVKMVKKHSMALSLSVFATLAICGYVYQRRKQFKYTPIE